MNSAVESVPPWSRLRWTVTIGIATALQLALVFAFSNRSQVQPRTGLATQVILPERVAGELQSLTDPTVLALGGSQGFAALWLAAPQLPPVDARWKETPQWLSLDPGTLGQPFIAFAGSSAASRHDLAFKTTPAVLSVTSLAQPKPLQTKSTLHVEGDLARRKLLEVPDLPSWPATDLLLPSEVRVLVDSRGRVLSAILQSGSGSKEADQFALSQARRARFSPAPVPTDPDAVTLGRLVFDWHATRAADQAPDTGSK